MSSILNIGARVRAMWSYRHEPENLRALSDAYWRFLLILATLIILCAALYGGWKLSVLLLSPKGDTPVLQAGGGGSALNRVELQATLDSFARRKAQYESLKTDRPQIVDPSR